MNKMLKKFGLLTLFSTWTALAAAQSPIERRQEDTRHGPANGSLLIIGGSVGSTPSIWNKFVELAGGTEQANIVVITTAAGDSAAWDSRHVEQIKKITGIQRVTLMHTTSIKEANTEAFVAPLREATGVYFIGGRQWRIANYFLNTLAHEALFEVLDRGGVIAGSSAGASIQGTFLWRGDTSGPHVLIGDHIQGLGFLKNSVIDQHLLKRNRQFDLVPFIQHAPDYIGLGLDEATAVVVSRDTLEVVGQSYVAIYDYNTISGKQGNGPFILLSHGQQYDLKNRKTIQEPRNPSTKL